MKNFYKILTEAIDDLLAKEGIDKLVSDFNSAKDEYKKQSELVNDKKDAINSQVAIEMKKILSKMGIVKNFDYIIRDAITLKYKSRSITLNPNIEESIWEIKPGSSNHGDIKFYKRIENLNGCKLDEWQDMLAKIAEAFRENYKSLQDDEYLAKKQSESNDETKQKEDDKNDE